MKVLPRRSVASAALALCWKFGQAVPASFFQVGANYLQQAYLSTMHCPVEPGLH